MGDKYIKPLFGVLCQEILPLVYDESLSYYEVLCKIKQKLNEVIETQNNLQDEFYQLKTWIDTQLETYTKEQLQEWLDDGTLENIISNLLLHSIKFFENEKAIKWNDLHENDYFMLSYHKNIDDLKNTIYLVKNSKTLECDLTNGSIYATPLSNLNNVITWGADNSGATEFDMSNIVNYLSDYDTLEFSNGVYLLKPININKDLNINGNNSIINFNNFITVDNVNICFRIGKEDNDKPLEKDTTIKDIKIKTNSIISYALWLSGYAQKLDNVKIYSYNGLILGTAKQAENNFSSDHRVNNSLIHGYTSKYGVGVHIFTNDNVVTDCKILTFNTSFSIYGDGSILQNIHDLYYTGDVYDENVYKKSCSVKTLRYLNTRLLNYYCDSMYKFIETTEDGGNFTLSNCYYYNYLSSYNCGCIIFDLKDTNFFECTGSTFNIPNGAAYGIIGNTDGRTYDSNHFILKNNVIWVKIY